MVDSWLSLVCHKIVAKIQLLAIQKSTILKHKNNWQIKQVLKNCNSFDLGG
jgi:hypothetical protein